MSRPKGACVYCGTVDYLHMDHVPPRNLFGRAARPDVITVPCCRKCNNTASKDDEYLLVFLALRQEANLQPEHSNLWQKFLRHLRRKEASGLRHKIVSKVKFLQPVTPTGIILPGAISIPIDGLRVSNIIVRIIKGLYFHEIRQRLPNTHLVVAHDVLALEYPPIDRIAEISHLRTLIGQLQTAPAKSIGRVFTYRSVLQPNQPANSMWLLDFFDGIQFFCISQPSGANLLAPPPVKSPSTQGASASLKRLNRQESLSTFDRYEIL
jgi:hypothetical protein